MIFSGGLTTTAPGEGVSVLIHKRECRWGTVWGSAEKLNRYDTACIRNRDVTCVRQMPVGNNDVMCKRGKKERKTDDKIK